MADTYNRDLWTPMLDVLAPIDGRRATWSRMLEPERRGHGLVPWIADIQWWDQVYCTRDLTRGDPWLLPAVIEWRAPTDQEIEELELPVPCLIVTGITAFGSDGDYFHQAFYNIVDYAEDWYEWMETGPEFAVPIWSVTPIDEDLYNKWSSQLQSHWNKFPEIYALPYLSGERAYSCSSEKCSSEYPCPECGSYMHDEEALSKGIYDDYTYWTQLDEPFPDVWAWGARRWAHAWTIITDKAEGFHPCQSSWALSRSPYFPTSLSDGLVRRTEAASLIPSTSSQLSLEFSTVA